MKVQPINIDSQSTRVQTEPVKPVLKSRLKRLFDRPFPSVLRISTSEKQSNAENGSTELEPSSICLDKMVQNFIEDVQNDKQPPPPAKYGRNRCNCFNGNIHDSSDDEFDMFGDSIAANACDTVQSLLTCTSVIERNLLADAAMIVEKNKNSKRKDDLRKIMIDGLDSLGYNSSICKSKWDKSSSFPAGDYEYIDVVVEGERILIDVDFRSEFEMARSTGAYKAIVQSLPFIFVGKTYRLDRIVTIVSEAAKISLKKKGMHLPPWRKVEYIRAKWLSRYDAVSAKTDCGEPDLILGDENPGGEDLPATPWQPPAVKSKSVERGTNIVTGLACLLKEKA